MNFRLLFQVLSFSLVALTTIAAVTGAASILAGAGQDDGLQHVFRAVAAVSSLCGVAALILLVLSLAVRAIQLEEAGSISQSTPESPTTAASSSEPAANPSRTD